MNFHSSQYPAQRLTEYYDPEADMPTLPLQRLEISHPDDFVPVKRMVSVHQLSTNYSKDDTFSTFSSTYSQQSTNRRPSKPLPKAPMSQEYVPPSNFMSPLTLPQQLSPIVRQSKPVYNSIFGSNEVASTDMYSELLNQSYDDTYVSPKQMPSRGNHSRQSTFESFEQPDSPAFLSPIQSGGLDYFHDDNISVYSSNSHISNPPSILSLRSMEDDPEFVYEEQEQQQQQEYNMRAWNEEEESVATPDVILPHLGTMGGGWRLSINNPSAPSDDELSDEHSSADISPVTPQDMQMPLRKKQSKEEVTLGIASVPVDVGRPVSPFWQQVSSPPQPSGQSDYFLQSPDNYLDPSRARSGSPASSIGGSSFKGSHRLSGSDFTYETRSSSPGLNIPHPIVSAVNDVSSADIRKSWNGNSSENKSPMNPQPIHSNRQRSSVPPPPANKSDFEPIGEKKSRYSIASHSLTNDPSTVKTMRRMANLTKDSKTQMVYALYLLEVCQMHDKATGTTAPKSATRDRLLKEAIYWIERLAKDRRGEACYVKGLWHEKGLYGYKQSSDKAHKMYQTAAKTGHVKSKFKLAERHEKKGNTAKAVAYYKSATVKGGVEPNFKMAQILLFGELKQKKNLKLGLEYLRRAADLANNTISEPAYMMGQILAGEFKRLKIPEDLIHGDHHAAVKYIRKAADLGYPDALDRMGRACQTGDLEQTVDLGRSFQFFEKAADGGQVRAMLSLSKMYLEGQAVEFNDALAFKWCERSAASGLDHAEFALGYYYEMGIGVEADYPRALEYYSKAASKGYEPAAAALNQHDAGSGKLASTKPSRSQTGRDNDHVANKDKECIVM